MNNCRQVKKSWGHLILASQSPRRFDLLKSLGTPFKVISVSIKEEFLKYKTPAENARRLAVKKAGAAMMKFPDDLILAADTVVTVDNKIFGKPKNSIEAIQMLTLLSGRKHEVITAIALLHKRNGFKDISHVVTQVIMKRISKEEILEYINKSEPMDKAGAYAIQGEGGVFVQSYKGCYDNVVGLPTSTIKKKLARMGF